MKMARELAGHGHRLQMIAALLQANGFHQAYGFLDHPHIDNELVGTADRCAARGTGAGQERTPRDPPVMRKRNSAGPFSTPGNVAVPPQGASRWLLWNS
jgi:hypothetical protein